MEKERVQMSNDLLKDFKPCPFCGGTKLKLTDIEVYYRCLNKYGMACISVECLDCRCDMNEMDDMIRPYLHKVAALKRKWNARAEVPEPVEEKYYITIHKVKQMGGKIVEAGGEVTQITYADRYNAVNTFSEMIDMIEGRA